VYFDSNILICAGWPFPSTQLLETVRLAQAADLDVCLPDLVLREVTAHWLRDLQAARQHLADKVKAFNRDTFGMSDMALPIRLLKTDELLAGYVEHTKKLTDMFRVVPTKDRPASFYTELALRRGGAFGEKGKGFHDTIILMGILEDMSERNYTHAIIVSKDGGFRLDGVKHLANTAKVVLTVIESLASLEKPVNDELSAKVVREIKAAKLRVIAMVRTREPELVEFLGKALDYTRDPLGPIFNTVSRREFLSFVDYVDAHAPGILVKPGPRKDFEFSIDIRVKVRERSEEFLTTEALSSRSFGFNSIYPENIETRIVEREMPVTVECEADISQTGVKAIRFTSIRDTKSGVSFTSLFTSS
jgi:hypothetical protein